MTQQFDRLRKLRPITSEQWREHAANHHDGVMDRDCPFCAHIRADEDEEEN